MKFKIKDFSYPKIVALGFILLIALGTILLMLPIASRNNQSAGFVNALLTATSASCVTGLIAYDTYQQWTLFGQLVIITLIQIGGLGFLTILAMFSMLFRRKIGLKERTLLQESVNSMYIGGIVKLVKKTLLGTAIIELTGAVLLSIRFIPEMGVLKGIYTSMFLSVSAFCNAGFDLMGQYEAYSSLTRYYDDPIVNLTISFLIITGGVGFFVWDDISRNKRNFKKYQLHTKLVLISTALLLLISTLLFWLFEYRNTIDGMSIPKQFLVSFFASVTPRTAGFNTTDTASLTTASKLLTMFLMFVGGSPGSTAGGVKTTTIAVIIICVTSMLRNNNNLNVFNRRIDDETLKKAAAVVCINFTLTITSTIFICFLQPEFLISDVLFETLSAVNTVGMTTGITRDLEPLSKILISLLMYTGRVGSLSFALIFTDHKRISTVQNPVEKVNIG